VNLVAEDRAMWLVDIRAQLVSNLENVQRQYKENANKHHKDQPNFKVGNQV
jgi:exosome complex RNA-binding protein Rrp4